MAYGNSYAPKFIYEDTPLTSNDKDQAACKRNAIWLTWWNNSGKQSRLKQFINTFRGVN